MCEREREREWKYCRCVSMCLPAHGEKKNMQAIYKLSADFNNLAPGTKVSERGGSLARTHTYAHTQTHKHKQTHPRNTPHR